jgi:hypothetical protein
VQTTAARANEPDANATGRTSEIRRSWLVAVYQPAPKMTENCSTTVKVSLMLAGAGRR